MSYRKHITALLLLPLLAGCATKPGEVDPYQSYNRKMFAFNNVIDQLYIRPIATLFSKSPSFVQQGVGNFIDNFQSLNSTANYILQFKIDKAMDNLVRFALNTTVGIFGLFDPAKEMGFPANKTDFGLTLAEWGYHKSHYFVMPLLGPSTVRDGIGKVTDYTVLAPSRYVIKDRELRQHYITLRLVDGRAELLPADRAREQALDPYIFVRNAYLQRRRKAVAETLGEVKKAPPTKAHHATTKPRHPDKNRHPRKSAD